MVEDSCGSCIVIKNRNVMSLMLCEKCINKNAMHPTRPHGNPEGESILKIYYKEWYYNKIYQRCIERLYRDFND